MAWSPDQELVVFMTGLGRIFLNYNFYSEKHVGEARKCGVCYLNET